MKDVRINQQMKRSLEQLAIENREIDFHHHSLDQDYLQYEYMKNGNPQAIEESKRMFQGPTNGRLSDNELQHYKFLFVCAATLCCRFCVEGGLPSETAYNMSDLYIRQVDKAKTRQEIFDLHETMFKDYTARMQMVQRDHIYSRVIHQALDYIETHLQQPILVSEMADQLGISSSYLSTLFKKEVGLPISDFVRRQRIETAKVFLQYTDYSCLDIAEYLCFSSDSHFSKVFREMTGVTPTAYRRQNYRGHWKEAK